MRRYPEVFRVTATPSPFRGARGEVHVRYFASLRRARRWGKTFCRHHPFADAWVQRKPRRGATQ